VDAPTAEAPVELQQRRRPATVLVCRGCCCGTARKHPDVDHEQQLQVWRDAAARGGALVRAVGCLGPCSTSNVVVVRSPGASTRTWFGWMLDEDATEAMAAWIAHGCRLPVPAALVEHELGPATSVVPS
jgi:hypothetical protein